jgi:hypothetical protein
LGRPIKQLPVMDQEFRIAFMRLNCTSVNEATVLGAGCPHRKSARVSVNNLSVNNEES